MKKEILKKSLLALTLTGLTGLTSSAFAASVNLGLSTADITTTVNGNVILGTCEITTGPKTVTLPKVSTGAIDASTATTLVGATPFELEITKCEPTNLNVEIVGSQFVGKFLKNEATGSTAAEGVAVNVGIKPLQKTTTTANFPATYTLYSDLSSATTGRVKTTFAGLKDPASASLTDDDKLRGKIYLQAGLVKESTTATLKAGIVKSVFTVRVSYN